MSTNMDHIIDGVYIGCYPHEQCRQLLKREGITDILQIGQEMRPSFEHDFRYLHVHILDTPDVYILKYFPLAFEFIDHALQNRGKVMIHCAAGISRSGSFCIGWMMRKYKMSFPDAFHYVKSKRTCIEPNPGFRDQLVRFQEYQDNKREIKKEPVDLRRQGQVWFLV